MRIGFLGHATVSIDVDGTKLLTDPLLRGRIAALMRRAPPAREDSTRPVDAVLISHMHQDHLDVPSLRRLGPDVRLLVPRRAGAFLARRGFRDVREMRVGDAVEIGSVRVVATPARHIGFRPPFGPFGSCLGFLVEGSARAYFAGDTGLFPGMADLGQVDVALLPVAGWGPVLGPGHMDPLEAARALRLLRPKLAVPIHWGTFAPVGLHLRHWPYLVSPPLDFVAHARDLAPDVEVRVLTPGESAARHPGAAPGLPAPGGRAHGRGHPGHRRPPGRGRDRPPRAVRPRRRRVAAGRRPHQPARPRPQLAAGAHQPAPLIRGLPPKGPSARRRPEQEQSSFGIVRREVER